MFRKFKMTSKLCENVRPCRSRINQHEMYAICICTMHIHYN